MIVDAAWVPDEALRQWTYHQDWFSQLSTRNADFIDVDASECLLPLGDLLDPRHIPERCVDVSGIDVHGQPCICCHHLRIDT